MPLEQLLADLRGDSQFMANVTAWRTLPAQAAQTAPPPAVLHPALRAVLDERGIPALYTHQAQAVAAALGGAHVAVVTPTASGKTLCYNLPVLHTLMSDLVARALYLFPTKALGHDQLDELATWADDLRRHGAPAATLHAAAYDGDTPSSARAALRRRARLLVTNPDMLHTGILPYHANWEEFFAGLRYVVLDEMHTYRGVFGSQVANVLRRLRRICAFYGSHPLFICTSATIANPGDLAERLVEAPVTVINETGAPRGEKHILLYNPPLFDAERGLRRSSTLESQELAARCILGGIQTIVFGRSRLTTELLLTYLRERVAHGMEAAHGSPRRRGERSGRAAEADSPAATVNTQIRGYRGGYLPGERRAIEADLRGGVVRGVVATNALELGIDIGQLQAAVLCGYPGAIASTWQQMGRAGRTTEAALAILVATGGALDQYVIRHPEFLFGRSPEHALINPDNLLLLVDQLRCAAFELPFAPGERFGTSPYGDDVLALLAEEGDVQIQDGHTFWAGMAYPARRVNLRSSGSDTVAIQAPGATVIGQLEHGSAVRMLHTGAVYLHEGQSYMVGSLDLEQNLAQVSPVAVDYYTTAISDTDVEVLAEHERRDLHGAAVAHGDLRVTEVVTGFRRVKLLTHETLGVFGLDYPPALLETTGYWYSILPEAQAALEAADLWRDSVNDYGPNWAEQRQRVRVRDGYRCTQCGLPEAPGRQHDVHHLVPFRTFGYVPGLNDRYLEANRLSNLALVCRSCHLRLESGVRVRSGLDGAAYALANLAPLYLMCDPRDLEVYVVRGELPGAHRHLARPDDALPQLPTVYIYERIAAGLGFSARLYELHETLLAAALDLITGCDCPYGCPACVGPVLELDGGQLDTKELALAVLRQLTGRGAAGSPAPAPRGEVNF
jgi:DEAD/DEAH box helicase domain-containing protein